MHDDESLRAEHDDALRAEHDDALRAEHDDALRAEHDDFPVEGIDHVHFVVGNAKQAAQYYSTALGMKVTAYRGPETGARDLAPYVLESGAARLLVSAAVHVGAGARRLVAEHRDGAVGLAPPLR